ncbi:MAG: hypothetical protein WKF58_20310 [Ilumatobacteraceae bacterium]
MADEDTERDDEPERAGRNHQRHQEALAARHRDVAISGGDHEVATADEPGRHGDGVHPPSGSGRHARFEVRGVGAHHSGHAERGGRQS